MSTNFYLGRAQRDPPSLEVKLRVQMLLFCSAAAAFVYMVCTTPH